MMRKLIPVTLILCAVSAGIFLIALQSPPDSPLQVAVSEQTPAPEERAAGGQSAGRSMRWNPRDVFRAFLQTYPGIVESVERQNGDYVLTVRGKRFLWADGKLLPDAGDLDPERFSPFPFYTYTRELPELRLLTGEQRKDLERRLEEREKSPPERHPGLYNTIWQISDRASADSMMASVRFLGRRVTVHKDIVEKLSVVEQEIRKEMETDAVLKTFVDSIASVSGFNYRSVAGTASVSFHSYGTALDVLPKAYGGKHTYWRWSMDNDPEWFNIPYERRFMPPESFIGAFERNGFIWGGKWMYFDTMHFEYRPEIFLLNGLED